MTVDPYFDAWVDASIERKGAGFAAELEAMPLPADGDDSLGPLRPEATDG
jgi:hypothetical protein